MNKMDINQIKKVKVTNLSVTRTVRNVDGPSPGKKMIAKLNHDCLAKVLMYVPVVERLEMEKVCQKWKEASELTWCGVKKLDFNDLMIPLDKKEGILEMIMTKCCQYLRHLKISGDQYSWMVDVLEMNCQNIVHFSIDINNTNKYRISNRNFSKIIMSMKKLKYFKLSIESRSSSNRFNQILKQLPENMEEIHLIVVPSQNKNEPYDVAPALNKFDKLHCLKLQGFRLTEDTWNSIFENNDTLTQLDLTDCEPSYGGLFIFKNLKNLEQLSLWKITEIDGFGINSIAHNCLKLKHLKLMVIDNDRSGIIKIPYRYFREFKHLNLEHLNFFGIDKSSNDADNLIYDIANNWKQLKYLDLRYSDDFSLLDIQEITKFKNLEYLNLIREKVDSQSFINIASNCLELKKLVMDLNEMPETALEKLTNLKKLESLHFFRCNNLTGNLLSKIVIYCKNLVDLNVSFCYKVTEASLIQVGKLKNLKKLRIDNIEFIPSAMFDNLHKLELLSCRYTPSITDEAMMKVLDNCKKLSTLYLTGSGITNRTLYHAAEREFVFTPLYIRISSTCGHTKSIQSSSKSYPYLEIR